MTRYARAICIVLGHKYTIVKKYTPTIRKLKCKRCGRYFGMNDDVQCIVPWDNELEDTHRDIENLTILINKQEMEKIRETEQQLGIPLKLRMDLQECEKHS